MYIEKKKTYTGYILSYKYDFSILNTYGFEKATPSQCLWWQRPNKIVWFHGIGTWTAELQMHQSDRRIILAKEDGVETSDLECVLNRMVQDGVLVAETGGVNENH